MFSGQTSPHLFCTVPFFVSGQSYKISKGIILCSTVVKVLLMWRLMLEFWRHMLLSKRPIFPQELHVYFSWTMPGLILQEVQQCGFVGIECVCLTGLPAVQICLLLKMYAALWRGESDNGDHGLYSPRMGKNATCKPAAMDIFSSQRITKRN